MPVQGFPTRVIIDGQAYKVAGEAARTPRWSVTPESSQPGEFQNIRPVALGDGSAGIIGSRRYSGRPTPFGVADVVNGDTSAEDVYGAGPEITSISLSDGNGFHAAGGIGSSLTIGGGSGAPSIGGPALSGTPTAIWTDGEDSDHRSTRYIYCIAGGRIKVIDPTDDSVVETSQYTDVDGGDVAKWAGRYWIALHGSSANFVKYVQVPYSPTTGTSTADTDFTATAIHAGPDALYRAYTEGANVALVKKSDLTTPAAVALDTNWAPSSGETMGEPSTPITNLTTLGERLVVGKEDGLGELDADFTFRYYLEWAQQFAWENNCRAIIPVGQGGEVIVGHRRGLYYLPLNKPIGTEVLTGNNTDKKGRYTQIAYDGNWFYGFLESPTTSDTHLIKMRPRRLPGPGLFEHHPIATFTDRRTLIAYIWPGAQVGATFYGPRMYFGYGTDSLAYIRLGETQPDQSDSNYRFTDGDWSITWPLDDFDSPTTKKLPYKVEATYENVTGTAGITWSVSTDGSTYEELSDNGTTLHDPAVVVDGFHQRFGPKDNSITGRALSFRVSGTGGATTAQQRILGQPVVYVLEQPEMVNSVRTTLQLERHEQNDNNAEAQWQALNALKGQGPVEVIANWGDYAPDTVLSAYIPQADRVSTVSAADSPGVLLVELLMRTLDFEDNET